MNSIRTYAAIRAHRTMLEKTLATMTNAVAKKALAVALACYDGELATAPVKTEKAPADRRSAALKAHRTMLQTRLPGTRGKARAAILAKIAQYDAVLAA